MEWEEAPEVSVPLVRPWLGSSLADLTRAFYGRRGWFFVLWWPFFIFYAFYAFWKLVIYAGIVALLLAMYAVWVVAELITYRHRRRRAMREVQAHREAEGTLGEAA